MVTTFRNIDNDKKENDKESEDTLKREKRDFCGNFSHVGDCDGDGYANENPLMTMLKTTMV